MVVGCYCFGALFVCFLTALGFLSSDLVPLCCAQPVGSAARRMVYSVAGHRSGANSVCVCEGRGRVCLF